MKTRNAIFHTFILFVSLALAFCLNKCMLQSLNWMNIQSLDIQNTLFWLVLFTFGSIHPLPSLIGVFVYTIYQGYIKCFQDILLYWMIFGALSGNSVLLNARFIPYVVLKPGHLILNNLRSIWPTVLGEDFCSQLFGRYGGILYTIATEILIVPPAITMMFWSAIQIHLGIQHDEFYQHTLHGNVKKQREALPLIVFFHGNGFNECQWLLGRFLLDNSDHVHANYLSVNIFKGLLLRNHHRHSQTVSGCASIAASQIAGHIKKHNLNPNKIILIGHSLGGLISTYIAEYLIDDNGKLTQIDFPVSQIIAISSPLLGSHILEMILQYSNAQFAALFDHGINKEFKFNAHPDLLKRIKQSTLEKKYTFRVITGQADALVRPSGAIPAFVNNPVTLNHLGHYNIKVSRLLWDHIERWVAQDD